MKNKYTEKFYSSRHERTAYAADQILSIVLKRYPEISSCVDFGCGVGTWLAELSEKNSCEVLGLDGPWVEENLLQIPPEKFRRVEFEKKVDLDNRFDLAISLEVAEHISASAADVFVDSITDASDVVLFSAAIPFQGGRGHINEQWQSYWAEKFVERGYVAQDFIRHEIWGNSAIPFWYKQNVIVYVKESRLKNLPELHAPLLPLSVVHPDTFISKVKPLTSLSGSWKLFTAIVRKKIKAIFGVYE